LEYAVHVLSNVCQKGFVGRRVFADVNDPIPDIKHSSDGSGRLQVIVDHSCHPIECRRRTDRAYRRFAGRVAPKTQQVKQGVEFGLRVGDECRVQTGKGRFDE
jgi:hypothetical protein